MAFDPKTATKKELNATIHAIEASTYLMEFCAVHKFGDDCEKCIFNKPDGCVIASAPFEYKPIGDKKEGGKND